ncbi:MAG: PAS domain S-box protein [Nitrospira sp.]|nr:PAS domain S-box protein [Nitrospira sp.]
MTSRVAPRLAESLRHFAAAAAVIVVLVGTLVLVGWTFDFDTLKSVSLGLVTMKVNTALSFILAGLSLWLLQAVGAGREWHSGILVSRMCAAGVVVIGGLTLSQDIGDLNFGIDQLLFPDTDPVDTHHPGRMSPVSALNFILVGAALLLLRKETRRGYRPTEFLIIPIIIISLLTLIGYLYDFFPLYRFPPHSAMAVHTAGTFVLLGTAVLAACPDGGLMALFTSEYPGGFLLRRLLPVAIMFPIVLGWVGLKSAYQGLFHPEFEVSALVTATVVLLLWCVWNLAGFIDHAHIERKEAEKALVLQSLLDAAPDATVTVDASGNIVRINRQVEALFGYRDTELIGRSVETFIPKTFHQRHENHRVMDQAGPGAWVRGIGSGLILHRKDGSEVPVEISRSPAHLGDGQTATIIAIRDVTERTRVAEALVSNETQMRLFMEATTDCIWNWDLTTGRVERNVGFQRRFGYTEEEIVPIIDWWSERLFPADRDRVLAFYENAIASGRCTCSYEYRFRCRDGSYATVSDRAFIIRDDTGQPIRALGAMTDITERVRAEDTLRESEEKFAKAFQDAGIGMALVSLEGRWLEVNMALCRITGYTERELLGMTFQAITHPNDLHADLALVEQMLQGTIRTYQMEKRYVRKDGQFIWVLLTVSVVRNRDDTPRYFISQIQDIDSRKRAEKERDQLVRRLVDIQEVERRAVALDLHDEVGQSLTAIKLALQCAQQPSQQASVPTLIEDSMAVADRVLQQVRNLSLMLHPSFVEECGLVYGLRWLATHQTERTGITAEVFADSALVRQPPGIELACFRIAQEALTNVRRHAQARHVSITLQMEKHNLELSIKDDGVGFLPFGVESKKPSLGLLGIQERARLVGGEVRITSVPGQGTEVRVIVPAPASSLCELVSPEGS